MRGFTPLPPDGTDSEALFARAVRDKTHGLPGRINSSSTVKVSKTSRGITFHAKPPKGGGAGVRQLTLIAVFGDYLKCVPVGSSPTSSPIYVAKPLKLRTSITSEVLDGTTVTYSITSNTTRTASFQGIDPGTGLPTTITENQVYVPRYLPQAGAYKGDVIIVQAISPVLDSDGSAVQDGSGNNISWLDLNVDGRAWST